MLGAALAYYTVFSLAPLLLIALAVAGAVFGEKAAHDEVSRQISGLLGSDTAKSIDEMVKGASQKSSEIWASVLGVAALLVGASGVFGQLQLAMNRIWGVEPSPKGGWLKLVKDRFLSLTMVMGTCFLLLVSLLASAGIHALTGVLGEGGGWLIAAEFVVSLIITTFLFAALFKFLPDTPVAWRDCWLGAWVTALLFGIGKYLIGVYIGQSGISGKYGAAGSVLVILLWVYYSAQILFFGAEVTKAVSDRSSGTASCAQS